MLDLLDEMTDNNIPMIISNPEDEQVVPHSPVSENLQPVTVPVSLPPSEDSHDSSEDPSDPSEGTEPMEEEEVPAEDNPMEIDVNSPQHTENQEHDTHTQSEEEETNEEAVESTNYHMPPPSHRAFRRYPNGALMKYTPRKSVRGLGKRRMFSSEQASTKRPRTTPPWMAQMQDWGREDGVNSRFEIGESSHAVTPPSEDSHVETAMPVIVGRITRLGHQVMTVSGELGIIEGNAAAQANRTQTLQHQLGMTQEQVTNQQARLTELEGRMQVADQRTIAAEARAALAEQKADSLYQQFTDLVFTLGSFFGLW